jgi:hypothetical protein
MKKIICLCNIMFFVTAAYPQLPKGPGGITLYQKGECKTIIPSVAYKCTFCEDEALTKNCKEYDCSLTECKESKSSKGSDGRLLSKPIDIEGKQIWIQNDSNLRTPKDTIDITEQIKNTKVRNGTVVVYETKDKYKIYATYKNGKLTEWYGMGEDGRKVKSTQLGITPTTCEDCLVHPNGGMYCKKCTTTPGVVLPAKSTN